MSSANFLSLVYFIGLIIIIVMFSIIMIVFIVQCEKTKRTKILASVLSKDYTKKVLKKKLKDNYINENETNVINIAEKLPKLKK